MPLESEVVVAPVEVAGATAVALVVGVKVAVMVTAEQVVAVAVQVGVMVGGENISKPGRRNRRLNARSLNTDETETVREEATPLLFPLAALGAEARRCCSVKGGCVCFAQTLLVYRKTSFYQRYRMSYTMVGQSSTYTAAPSCVQLTAVRVRTVQVVSKCWFSGSWMFVETLVRGKCSHISGSRLCMPFFTIPCVYVCFDLCPL